MKTWRVGNLGGAQVKGSLRANQARVMQTNGLDALRTVAGRCCKAQRKGRALDSQHGISLCETLVLHKATCLLYSGTNTLFSNVSHLSHQRYQVLFLATQRWQPFGQSLWSFRITPGTWAWGTRGLSQLQNLSFDGIWFMQFFSLWLILQTYRQGLSRVGF